MQLNINKTCICYHEFSREKRRSLENEQSKTHIY